MREDPPAELTDLLSRLKLADGAAIRGAAGRAKSLARGLPLFPTVWVDALAQARRITPFQAAQINAGRGAELLIGPYVATHPPRSLGYAVCQRARALQGGGPVELLIARPVADRAEDCLRRLTEIVEKLVKVDSPAILRTEQAGQTDERQWIAFPASEGQPLDQWILRNGRLPGDVVLEIARQAAIALAALERAGLVHGDLSPAALRVGGDGAVSLTWSGAREIWRPEEGWAQAGEMPLEAYDYLAPERAADRAAISAATDLYAWGLLMWHLATGRVPLPGGDVSAKLRASGRGKIDDVGRLAPETPPLLAEAIRDCTQRDPQQRPRSFAELTAKLGPATPAGKRLLARTVVSGRQNWRISPRGLPTGPRWKQAAIWSAGAAACLAFMFITGWPWRGGREQAGRQPAAKPAAVSRASAPKHGQIVVPAIAQDPADATPKVTHAGYIEPESPQTAAENSPAKSETPSPLVLPAGKPQVAPRWQLQAGQTVRSQPGSRAMVLVPPGGLIVTAEDVRFENIDFAWAQLPRTIADPENLAIIDLRAARATFQGCTFQAVSLEQLGGPAAIRWSGPRAAASDGRGELGPSGRVRLSGCVLSGVAAGIDCRLDAPLAVQISDTLHLGPGPLVAMPRPPRADEPRAIALDHTTLRGARALLELHSEFRGESHNESPSDGAANEAGNIAITAAECAFAPGNGALLLVSGEGNAKRLIRCIEWSGQGSLLQTGASVAARLQSDGGKIEPLDAAELAIDGLVASRIEFAGPADSGVANSRVVRWQAPLESADPPGIDAALPPLPPLRNLAR